MEDDDRNDVTIDQIARYIISYRDDFANNVIYRGLITYDSTERLNITSSGKSALEEHIKRKAL